MVCLILAFGQGVPARAQDVPKKEWTFASLLEAHPLELENEGATVDYYRDDANFSQVRADYRKLKLRAGALAHALKLATFADDKQAVQTALVKTTVYLKQIVLGGEVLGAFRSLSSRRELYANLGGEEIITDFEKWLPDFLERPLVAEAIVDTYWQNGKAELPKKHYETLEEGQRRAKIADPRLRALELLLSRVNGPDKKRVAHLILNPKMGLDDWRYSAVIVAARKNPDLFSRALQGEFIKRVDLIQRVAPHQFLLTDAETDKHPGNDLVDALLGGIEKVPAPWVTKALKDLATYDRYPEVLRANAALKLGQRAENFPGADADQTSKFLQGLIRKSELSDGHREKILAGLPTLSETDFQKLLADIVGDPKSLNFLGTLVRELPKKAPEKLSAGARADLIARYQSFLKHPNTDIRWRAARGLTTLIKSDAFPYLLATAAEELRTKPKGYDITESLFHSITDSIEKFDNRDEMFSAYVATLKLLDEHYGPQTSQFDASRLAIVLLQHYEVFNGNYQPPAKLQQALIGRLSSILTKAGRARAAYTREEEYRAFQDKILFAFQAAVEATTKDATVPVTLEGDDARALVEFALHQTEDSEWQVSRNVKLMNGLEQKLLPREKEKWIDWLLTQPAAGRRAGIELAGKYQLPRTIETLTNLARTPGPDRGIALDALAKIAARYPKDGNAALTSLAKDPWIAGPLAPAPTWKEELEKLKVAVRKERAFQFAQPGMLAGTFTVAGGTEFNRSKEPFTIEITLDPSREDHAGITFQPQVVHYFSGEVELSHGTWHSTFPPRFAIGIAEGDTEPTFRFEGGSRTLRRVLPKDDDYPASDPCGTFAAQLPATPTVTRALLLKACVAFHWSETPYNLKRQAFVDLQAHAKNLGTSKMANAALRTLWGEMAKTPYSKVVTEANAELMKIDSHEKSNPPPPVHPAGTHTGGKK